MLAWPHVEAKLHIALDFLLFSVVLDVRLHREIIALVGLVDYFVLLVVCLSCAAYARDSSASSTLLESKYLATAQALQPTIDVITCLPKL